MSRIRLDKRKSPYPRLGEDRHKSATFVWLSPIQERALSSRPPTHSSSHRLPQLSPTLLSSSSLRVPFGEQDVLRQA